MQNGIKAAKAQAERGRERERAVQKATTEKGGHVKAVGAPSDRTERLNTTDAARAVSSQFNHLNRRVSLSETDEELIGPVCMYVPTFMRA